MSNHYNISNFCQNDLCLECAACDCDCHQIREIERSNDDYDEFFAIQYRE